jgi:hypothetical protein
MNHTSAEPARSSTAFRLPTSLLQVIDKWCGDNDITRSQFFRRCISDRVKSLGLQSSTLSPKQPEEQTWSPELYDRMRRKG